MNKISLYILLVLLFLGLSKSFSPSEQKIPSLLGELYFETFFTGAPISVVLTDSFQTGFLIKTYFQKYKIIHGFKPSEFIIVKTSQTFWENNLKNVGMSLFRRNERDGHTSTIPMPPGSLYLGDPAYGSFETGPSGIERWTFYRGYRHFPTLFEWGAWRPDEEFIQKMEAAESQSVPFYGSDSEFGEGGAVTSSVFKNSYDKTPRAIAGLGEHMRKFWHVPKWKRVAPGNETKVNGSSEEK